MRLALLDNTVLTNFALLNRPDLVQGLWGAACVTTPAVMAEYAAGVARRGLPESMWSGIRQLALTPSESNFAASLPPRLGAGERSCIAAAMHRDGLLATDDKDARRQARVQGIPMTGTLGILALNVRQGHLSLDEGNELLAELMRLGYRSPVTTLNELVE